LRTCSIGRIRRWEGFCRGLWLSSTYTQALCQGADVGREGADSRAVVDGQLANAAIEIVFSLTYAGLATVNARLVMTARVFGASSFQLTRHVVVPSVLPFIFTGLQVALPWAVSAALVAEYLAAKEGIGHGIEEARQLSDSVGVYYGIVLATVLVLLCNGVLAFVRKLAIKVQP